MKQSIVQSLFFWVTILMIMQPIYSYRDYLIDTLIKSNAHILAQKSAVEGYMTPSIKQIAIENLSVIGFAASEIEVNGSSLPVDRGTRIDVVIRAPRSSSFPFNFSNEEEVQNYYAHANIMSEYLD